VLFETAMELPVSTLQLLMHAPFASRVYPLIHNEQSRNVILVLSVLILHLEHFNGHSKHIPLYAKYPD
jgi:hypothetical protein